MHESTSVGRGAEAILGVALTGAEVATPPPSGRFTSTSVEASLADSGGVDTESTPSVTPSPIPTSSPSGNADVSSAAVLFADPTRARILSALGDGRSLAAGVLAAEAGISAQAASTQLSRLREAGFIEVEQSGRHRFYRLASPQIARALEALAVLAHPQPVRSLREGNRAAALRAARTCYDHLAGRLGVDLTQALLDRKALTATDGIASTARRAGDRLSSRLADHPYQLGPEAVEVFGALGVPERELSRADRRPLLQFCLDWSEQRHHLAGRLGSAVLTAVTDAGWIERRPHQRAVRLTEAGATGLGEALGLAPSWTQNGYGARR
jgi:DNA-binding transcriptional ArsR family regulator